MSKRIDVNICNYEAIIGRDPAPGPIIAVLPQRVEVWDPPGATPGVCQTYDNYYVLPFTEDKAWVEKAVRMALQAHENKAGKRRMG
jgi:hypothetical protein